MSYIYHMVPKNLIGHVLVPLQSLREISEENYRTEIKKYDDHPKRKELPQRVIKKLNCPQSEVLHFSPIHPHLMFKGLKSIFPEWNYSSKYFEIPIQRIEGLPAIKFDMNVTGSYVFGEDEPEEMFEWVTPQNYEILREIPVEAIEFYQQWRDRGERGAPAMARIPHVMVRGEVDINGCRVIDWKSPI